MHYIWQNNHQICGHIRCVYTLYMAEQPPNMRSYTVCIYIIFGRTTTKYAVIYGVYIRYFWQGNHQIYGRIRCVYTLIWQKITKYAVTYGVYKHYVWQNNHQICGHIRCVYTVFLAGKSPNIRSDTAHMYGSGQPYTYYPHAHKDAPGTPACELPP
jgi:hypothetical protein